jgi:hypothetical protein
MPLTRSDIAKIRDLIREELAVLAAQSLVHSGGAGAKPPQVEQPPLGPDVQLQNYAAVTRATGLGRWTLGAIKRASRGEPDSPFTGRITTARRLNRWLADHPQFVPRRIYEVGTDRK